MRDSLSRSKSSQNVTVYTKIAKIGKAHISPLVKSKVLPTIGDGRLSFFLFLALSDAFNRRYWRLFARKWNEHFCFYDIFFVDFKKSPKAIFVWNGSVLTFPHYSAVHTSSGKSSKIVESRKICFYWVTFCLTNALIKEESVRWEDCINRVLNK